MNFPAAYPAPEDGTTAKAKLARLDRRCVHLRREAAHQLTTELAGAYGHIVIEDLDVAAMKRGMGRRAFRRAVSDAGMGAIKPLLVYKTARCGGRSDGGGSLVRIQPDPPRLHPTRRRTLSPDRQRQTR